MGLKRPSQATQLVYLIMTNAGSICVELIPNPIQSSCESTGVAKIATGSQQGSCYHKISLYRFR
jgi:hypothetical protein